MFRMLLHSSSVADDCMWVYRSVSVCTGVLVRFSCSTPTYSRQLLRMNVITFETCLAIKNFDKVTSSWFNLFN